MVQIYLTTPVRKGDFMKQIQHALNTHARRVGKFYLFGLLGMILCLASATQAQVVWTKHAENPVLEPGPAGSWDDNYLIEPYVLFDGTNYKMWYGGHDGANSRIGYATSPDGVVWTRDALNPVLDLGPTGSWDDFSITASWVLYDSTTYHMWYHGHDGTSFRIGYATSPDGVDWTKYSGNPVLDLGASGRWDDRHVETPVVLMLDDTTFFMWYGGRRDATPVKIGLATSSDGVEWEKWSTNPVLNVGTGWENEGIFPEAVILIDDTLRMWYIGLNSTFDGRSGYATSSDGGVEWAKYEGNPVLDIGDAGAWDDVTAAVGAVHFEGTKYEMWYDSWDGANQGSIGYATAPDSIPTLAITDEGIIPDEYVLSQNYPNPFNPVSTIRYEIPMASEVLLIVYDILGREVVRLVDGFVEPGYHEVHWNGQEFASGIYIARLETSEYSKSIKMVLVK
jgi:predicted GH43/DUF377 family glycosyl hydrolase